MKISPEVERLMRDVERKVRQEPLDSIKTLCGLQVIGEGLAIAQIYFLVGPLSSAFALTALLVLVTVAVVILRQVECWIIEIAALYQIDEQVCQRMLVVRPVWLALTLMLLMQLGLSFLVVIVQLGAIFAAVIGVLIYAAFCSCMCYAPPSSKPKTSDEQDHDDD